MRSVAVIELADVFRRFADGYLSAHGTAMPASHRRAIADILACRTEALGGHLWRCDRCSHEVFSYHCKNRSCPKCHTKQAKDWLDARKAEILPTDYFHVTITVPQELRALLRANQRDGYALLMKAAADAIMELAHDRRFVGGTVGVLAVLHTWTQQLVYHPHVHCLVTGSISSRTPGALHTRQSNRVSASASAAETLNSFPSSSPLAVCHYGQVSGFPGQPGNRCELRDSAKPARRASHQLRCPRAAQSSYVRSPREMTSTSATISGLNLRIWAIGSGRSSTNVRVAPPDKRT